MKIIETRSNGKKVVLMSFMVPKNFNKIWKIVKVKVGTMIQYIYMVSVGEKNNDWGEEYVPWREMGSNVN